MKCTRYGKLYVCIAIAHKTAAEVETAEAVETEQIETQPEAPTYEELQARIAELEG